jgi:biotin transport system substrate-specific component
LQRITGLLFYMKMSKWTSSATLRTGKIKQLFDWAGKVSYNIPDLRECLIPFLFGGVSMQLTNTIADVFRPTEKSSATIYDVIIIVFASLLVGLSAQLRIYLPISPVPITAQTFAVLVLGILLGSRRGGLAMLAYLVEGILGLPVFAAGVGLPVILGPTGGYLVGFVAAAYLVGRLAEMGWDRHIITTIAAMLAGEIVLYTFGVCWLAMLTNIRTALTVGLYPFVVGDILKVALAAAVLPAGWMLVHRGEK